MPSYVQCTRDCNDAFVDSMPEVPLDPLGLMAGTDAGTTQRPRPHLR
jgi:hypothetical protein